jgi:hypothetical protein
MTTRKPTGTKLNNLEKLLRRDIGLSVIAKRGTVAFFWEQVQLLLASIG